MKAQTEGEPKLRSILGLSEDLLTGTSIAGQEMVRREVDSVQGDWQSFITNCSQVMLPPSFSHSVPLLNYLDWHLLYIVCLSFISPSITY